MAYMPIHMDQHNICLYDKQDTRRKIVFCWYLEAMKSKILLYCQRNYLVMQSCCSSFANFMRKPDLFSQTSLIRYNGQAEYGTAVGGILSIVVIFIFVTLFFNQGLKTMRREIITSTKEYESQMNPSNLTFKIGPGHDMMFGVWMNDLSFSEGLKFFDVAMVQEYYEPRNHQVNIVHTPLVPCTEEHFNFSQQLMDFQDEINVNEGLCPQLGQELTIGGNSTSKQFTSLYLYFTRCDYNTDVNCKDDTQFTNFLDSETRFELNLYVIQPNINAGMQDYKTWDLDQHTLFFDGAVGSYSFNYIQQNSVKTDNSILPWEDIREESVTNMDKQFRTSSFMISPAIGQLYAEISLKKSGQKTTYIRSFNKIDNYFSYVGGLVGTMIALFFLMGFYTEKAFEVSVGKKLMVDDQGKEISSGMFHVGYFILMTIKKGFQLINIDLNWKRTQNYIDFCEEACQQIDVGLMIKKMLFFDAAIEKLMEKHEIKALCMQRKPTLKKAKENRKKFYLDEIFWMNQEKKEKESGQEKGISKQKVKASENISGEFVTSKVQDQSENFSVAEICEENEEMIEIESVVMRIMSESREGKDISIKIMQEMNPHILKHYEDQKSGKGVKSIEYVMFESLGDEEQIHKRNLSQEGDFQSLGNITQKDFNR